MKREDMQFDVRTLPYRLSRGEITQEQVDKVLGELPDDADNADETQTAFTTPWQDRLDAEGDDSA